MRNPTAPQPALIMSEFGTRLGQNLAASRPNGMAYKAIPAMEDEYEHENDASFSPGGEESEEK